MNRVTVALAAGVLALAVAGGALSTDTAGVATASSSGNSPNKQFDIADTPGRPAVLYPGAHTTRWIRLSNPANFAIKVTTVTATVGTPRTTQGNPMPSCPSGNVVVGGLSAPVTVEADRSADTALPIRMADGAPSTCKNLTFPLTYSGTAVKP